ncbi:MAG TPA: PQQ-dependent sugar dehydrogenase [Membranihabitans sp.]|nr:PQQ-dependent sugar dehydrogenase [Membranihabitans sp.]
MKRNFTQVWLLLILTFQLPSQNIPEGFYLEEITDRIDYPVGMAHTGTEDSYIWTQDGKVWLVRDGQLASEPILDISDEVGFWSDHGLLGMALHPDFSDNGWIYLMYVVDRYHLYHADQSDYDPTRNEYNQATIARITRYTIRNNQVDPDSRKIILGTNPGDGIPITTKSHGIGTLLFGRDGSLLFSVGDGSAPGKDYVGQTPTPEAAFDDQALEDGILREKEYVGAYRAQYLNSYCGKILRIDPETGLGLSTNPFYDPSQPDRPISKVWALGFRNPFRMTLFPGNTNETPDGPGDLLVGDVGDWSWEEINIVDGPGLNFGWPVYQGQDSYYLFRDKKVPNYDAPIGNRKCEQEYFYFKDLIVQGDASHSARFVHPCGSDFTIPDSIPQFVHQRPALSYANWVSEKKSVLTPGFDENGDAQGIAIGDSRSSIIQGNDFNGSSSIAGVFYTLDGYPESFHHAYFHGDFQGWLRVFTFNENREVETIQDWTDKIGGVVDISENPYDQSVYVVTHDPHRIFRVSFEGNRRPVIQMTPDTLFGPAPLTALFDASASYDPEGEELQFTWILGNDTLSHDPILEKTFTTDYPETYRILLVLTDASGKSNQREVLVSVNNSPPEVEIVSIGPEDLYSVSQSTSWPLEAMVSDAEHELADLQFEWTVFLHHNTHFHQEAQYFTPTAVAHIEPLGCGIETYHYRIRLAVEDPLGLQTVREKLLFPNCDEVNSEFRIYPNPSRGVLNLESTKMDVGAVKIFIHDQTGRLYYKDEGTIHADQPYKLNLMKIPAGWYVLQIFGENFHSREVLLINF